MSAAVDAPPFPDPTEDDIVGILERHGGPMHESEIFEAWAVLCVERACDAAAADGELERIETENGPVYRALTGREAEGRRIPVPPKDCEHCGKPLTRKRRPNGSLESRAHYNARKFCDRKCEGAARTLPTDDIEPPNPSGLCQCGCGEKAPLAKWTDRRPGARRVKGLPARYIKGHSTRNNPARAAWLKANGERRSAERAPRREAVELLWQEGLGMARIAERLGVPYHAVTNDIRWLRAQGRIKHERRYGDGAVKGRSRKRLPEPVPELPTPDERTVLGVMVALGVMARGVDPHRAAALTVRQMAAQDGARPGRDLNLPPELGGHLNSQQRAVLTGLYEGKTYRVMARELGISPQRVGQIVTKIKQIGRQIDEAAELSTAA